MSEVKVNKISPRSGTTVTLGDSGDTFTIPSGATINNQGTATNFGATGSASWVTTVKTGDFTAVAGEGYFVNTTSGAITVTLPASPSAGAVVAVKDYANTFDTNAVTLGRNGSNIGGQALDSTISTEGLAVTLVFVDATKGWLVTDSGLQDEAPGPLYITASGGTPTTDGDFKIHTFTGPGTFSVSCAGNASGNNQIEYLVVAGGGGGGASYGGGAGAGGFRFASPSISPLTYPAKPLAGPATITAAAQTYPIAIGAGGAGSANNPSADSKVGSVSTFSTITSTGGGAGAYTIAASGGGSPGGSGGGGSVSGSGASGSAGTTGTGNTPPTSPAQGTNGGNAYCGGGYSSGGGGGAIQAGVPSPNGNCGGQGGDGGGLPTAFGSNGVPCGSYRYYAGGGGGGGHNSGGLNVKAGGKGGGGDSGGSGAGQNSPANSGGGGGGGSNQQPFNYNGGTGGSGIVVIRYKFQN